MKNVSKIVPLAAAFALGLFLALTLPVFAQGGPSPLPTAPGADRAAQDGGTQAKASLPGAGGASPLEPWLVTWLLPVSGIIAIVVAGAVDRRARAAFRTR